MKLATIHDGTRDGRLAVVRRDGQSWVSAHGVVPTLQAALDDWDEAAPKLRKIAQALDAGALDGNPTEGTRFMSPLPRAYEWVDGSAYLNHVKLVRKARNAEIPPTLETDPLVYQGGSGTFLGPTEPIPLADPAWGCDFESEVVVCLGDVPQGISAAEASKKVRLVLICNDVTLRNLVPNELAKSFGFFQSKPSTAFGPYAVTPDELGAGWDGARVQGRMKTWLNDRLVGDTDTGPEMHFSFPELIAHIAKTRPFTAGTLLGSGTISNADRERGISCLAEQRTLETLDDGAPKTPFLKAGDRVRIELQIEGKAVCGTIAQVVAP